MKELVVISGKGGTGKTSLVASLAALAENAVVADCDVDTADLHLILRPEREKENHFCSSKTATIDNSACIGCGICEELCRYGAIRSIEIVQEETPKGPVRPQQAGGNNVVRRVYSIDGVACEGCGVCEHFCPGRAVTLEEEENGKWYVSGTRFGPMVHAHLNPGSENSGKLVTLIRQETRKISGEKGLDLVLVDGSPGIGCPVIASISGSDFVLIVTEPTMSGVHDLERVVRLTKHFGVQSGVVINKFDINEGITAEIEKYACKKDMILCGRIRYDSSVTEAQMACLSVVELSVGPAARDIRNVWSKVQESIGG